MDWKKELEEALEKGPTHVLGWTSNPPCRGCKNWSPRLVTDEKGEPKKVICCLADKMKPDFSCYQDPKDFEPEKVDD